ncbi:WD40 repeat domain-containing protein [Mycolicibacterium neworleansense]|uniref:Putative regulatory protein n=1 Tax=Mycolicibacterium neworleansense TaxID=146018 RepID=A0A0H5RUC2_9MYCO|nr:WD40 repeat domain-containing protein [Mycolicibacterium neworleansense]MCV7363253.1 WD40 repeat domain-containing protein [Mycolicibacterium neworleansense]CRZ17147.1 putative regulatory protein [Mycolicibacterium neworleansense]
MTHATITTRLDADNPWPGLESYCEDAQGFFYGRVRECEKLLKRVLDAPVTVLFGRSGLGKTSLLHAGLFPLLRNENYLPIYVRFDLKPGAASLSCQLHDAVRHALQAEAPDATLPRDDESLWEYLHRADLELWSTRNYLLTPVLVLDQFEELFTLGEGVPDQVEAFKYDLADLAENRIPADLATRIKDDPAEARRFNLRSHNCKLLISLREDFLAHLEDWCRFSPALGRSRMRLLPLGIDEAFEAVYKPAEHLMTPELAHQVVDIIAGAGLHTGAGVLPHDVDVRVNRRGATDVEPTLLSLVCRELNEERKRLGKAAFDEQLVEEHGRSTIPNYYTSCVSGMRPEVAEFIENQLITTTGFRDFEAVEDAVPSHLTREELDQLIDSRLVRLAEYHGTQRIELIHDVLTGTVRSHRDQRNAERSRRLAEEEKEKEKAALAEAAERARERERAAQAQLAVEERAKIEAQRQTQALLKRTRQLRAVLAAAVVVAVVAASLWVWAIRQRNEAQEHFRAATAERLYGESLLMLAGRSPLGSNDFDAMQMLLAAYAIPSTEAGRNYDLLTVLNEERNLLKVIDLPFVVRSVAFSPDGSRIVSGSADSVVQVWDAVSGQPVGTPMRHGDRVTSVAFSPDGSRIVSGSADNSVRVWDAVTGQSAGEPMRHDAAVMSVAFSPAGSRIVSGGADKTVRVWDTASGKPVGAPMRHSDTVASVAFSPDGSHIVSGGYDKTVRVWDAVSGRPVGAPMTHGDRVMSVAFGPDGAHIASGSADKTVQMWDAVSGRAVGQPMRHDAAVMSVAFSPDGARIASASYDNAIQLWDVAAGGSEPSVLLGHESPVWTLAFSPDSRELVSAGGDDGSIRLWDATSWQPMRGHSDAAWAGYFDGGRRIGSGSGGDDKTVRWWDAETGQPIGEPLRVDGPDVGYLFPVDQNRLLSLSHDTANTVAQLWDARSGKPIGEALSLPPGPNREVVADDTTNPRIAVKLEPSVLQVYKSDTMRPVGALIRPTEEVATFNFSHDGEIVATGSVQGTVELWDSDTGERIGRPMKGDSWVASIVFSNDGSLMAVGYANYRLRLWDTGTFEPKGEDMPQVTLPAVVALSPDNRTIASGGDDGNIQLWDVDGQKQLGAPLTGHSASVTSLHFSSDGKKLLSSSGDGTLRVWPVLEPDPNLLCAKLTHNLTPERESETARGIDYDSPCTQLTASEYAGQR